MRIFWSWQSDNHQPSGRYFVRDVLSALVVELNDLDAADDAERPDAADDDEHEPDDAHLQVDHDTLDIAGSPQIAETILRKISEAAVFVADVTPVGRSAAGKLVPNPNVMMELGYAMHVLGHHRIVLVMNQAEGAALRHLPFDLRHWRGPVAYSMKKGATEAELADESVSLEDRLRERIVPSLRAAERAMREDRRRTHRSPELSVAADLSSVGSPIMVSQATGPLDVGSLDEIKCETPFLPLPPARDARASQLGASLRTHASLSALFDRPVSDWTREETMEYNGRVERFYGRYEEYLDALAEHVRLRKRINEMSLDLVNDGTSPATDIDAELHFPPGVIIRDPAKGRPQAPDAPRPPRLVPARPGYGVAELLPADAPIWMVPPPLRPTRIDADNRMVRFQCDALKHHDRVKIDPILACFDMPADIGPLKITYRITANEPIDPFEGEIVLDVQLAAD